MPFEKTFAPLAVLFVSLFFCHLASAQTAPASDNSSPSSLVARVRDTGFIQITADAFNDLSSEQKLDAYWLSMAAIAINPIAYDQNSPYGLQEKRILEAILTHPNGVDPAGAAEDHQLHHAFLGQPRKSQRIYFAQILPDFTFAEFRGAAEQARQNGATQLGTATSLLKVLAELEKPIFDPASSRCLQTKIPPPGKIRSRPAR